MAGDRISQYGGGLFMRILIVEDDVILALSMDETLAETGHQVVGLARDHGLAMRMASSMKPDLALVDLKLVRGISGAEVARRLRRSFGIATIFVSGSPEDCERVGFYIGALGCLAKPFTPDQLIDAVDAAEAIMRRQSPARVPANLDIYYVT